MIFELIFIKFSGLRLLVLCSIMQRKLLLYNFISTESNLAKNPICHNNVITNNKWLS